MNISISAVIPAYNGEKFIHEALESIVGQTYPVSEIVVIDDGSKDNTSTIVEEFKKTCSIPIILVHHENSGVSATRNVGLASSTSDLIAFLDVDDLWFPNKLEEQIQVFKDLENLELFCFTDYFHDQKIDSTRKFKICPKAYEVISKPYTADRFQINFIKQNFVGTASTLLFNRKLALKIGGFKALLNHSEDFDFILRYSNHAEMIGIDKPLVLKRSHGENLTGNLELHFWSHYYVLAANLAENSKYTRFPYSAASLKAMAISHDEYIVKYCNIMYEKFGYKSFKYFFKYWLKVKTTKGFINVLVALMKKLVRWLSMNKIKR